MKTRVYIRIGKKSGKPKVAISLTPKSDSLDSGSSYNKKYYPTVLIGLDLDIPDKEFEATRILLEAKIKETKPAVEIKQVFEEIK